MSAAVTELVGDHNRDAASPRVNDEEPRGKAHILLDMWVIFEDIPPGLSAWLSMK